MLGRPDPLGMGVVELQYLWSQPSYVAASVPFLQVSAMHEPTRGPIGGPHSEAGDATWCCAKQDVQQLGMSGCGTPVPLGGNGGKTPVPAGAVPRGIDWEAETDVEEDGVALAEAVPGGILKEREALLPVGTGFRQKSFNHQLYRPLSVALQRVEMQVSTRGPSEGAHKASGLDTLNCWKHSFQQLGIVLLPEGG